MLSIIALAAARFGGMASRPDLSTGRSNRGNVRCVYCGSNQGRVNDAVSELERSSGTNYVINNQGDAPDPNDKETLSVIRAEFDVKRITVAHHTDEYDITEENPPKLVIRRGQEFDISLKLNRAYDKSRDELRLVFQIGDTPLPSRRSHVEIVVSEKDEKRDWGAYIKSTKDDTAVLTVITGVKAHVGKWKLKIDVVKAEDTGYLVKRHPHPDPIYILFNPWCRDDQVYLHDDMLRAEYVLNDKGVIFRGSSEKISFVNWTFGQFSGNVLDCCSDLLDKNMGNSAHRGDAVQVCRKISALANAPNEDGILVGNWSGDYTGGTSPLAWTGSTEIFEQYHKGKSSVQFGQCWVFSGLCTTFCRALGIPARSVTNFSSAHDTDSSMTIDYHFDDNDEEIKHLNRDSVWNFHVWNDAWMTRPDLPSGYGGWQAIDATPQELTHGGVFACGPVSLVALRQGEVHMPFDGPFVFAEVNGDKVYWRVGKAGEKTIIGKNRYAVGQKMSTKKPGTTSEREDVTIEYKYPEWSTEERIAVQNAGLYNSAENEEPEKPDVKAEFKFDVDTFVGTPLFIGLVFTNTSSEPRTIKGRMVLDSIYYTGVHYKKIKTEYINLRLGPNSEETVVLNADQDEYYSQLTDHCMFKVTTMVSLAETNLHLIEMKDFRFRKPHLTTKVPSRAKKNEKITAEVSFQNPLNMTLTDCHLVVDGPGLQRAKTIKQSNVAANATFTASVDLVPFKKGERELHVAFNSAQIYSVIGSANISVSE